VHSIEVPILAITQIRTKDELSNMKTKLDSISNTSRVRSTSLSKCFILSGVVLAFIYSTIAGEGIGGKRDFKTMTANLYIGGDATRIIALDVSDPNYLSNLVFTVTSLYQEIVASQPAVRLQGLAKEIAARQPDVVAVEEGTLLRVQSPGDLVLGGKTSATNVVFDYVQLLVNALEAQGAHYAVASISEEWDVELPMLNLQTGSIDDIRQTDREAILVRTDLPRGQLHIGQAASGHFTNGLYFPTIGLSFTRGWCSVDVFVRGQVFRYICAHLEQEVAPALQVLQAQELIAGPAKTSLPVLLVGDFNSDSLHRDGSIAYDTFTSAGFNDTWALLNPANPAGGLTWGHDEFLADPNQLFDRRIDFVFFRGNSFSAGEAEVIDVDLHRSDAPLWASDHASLSAQLLIGPQNSPKQSSLKRAMLGRRLR
jgi:endonuclease/exonuclease/phosphatase family metal-dependent hydrolase